MTVSFQEFSLTKSPTNLEKTGSITQFGKGTTNLLDILKKIRKTKKDEWTNVTSSFVLDEKYGDLFLDYADSIKLPDWFDAEKKDVGQVVKLMEWFRDMAAVVYVQAEFVNDFFLLHGVTGTQVQSVCIVYQF